MPIYEYQCKECGTHIEKRQSVSDEPLKTCEKCGGELAKQWSLSGFQFKGEGWYVTDYAGKKDKGGEKTTSGKPVSTDTTEKSSPSESTTAADTASKPKSETPSTPKTDGGPSKS
jgi:putative FmdB family regulatory protein